MPLVPHLRGLAYIRGHLKTEMPGNWHFRSNPQMIKDKSWCIMLHLLLQQWDEPEVSRHHLSKGPQQDWTSAAHSSNILMITPFIGSSFFPASFFLSLIPSPKKTTWTQLLVSGSAFGRPQFRCSRWGCQFQGLFCHNWVLLCLINTRFKKRLLQTPWRFTQNMQFVYLRLMTMPSGKDGLGHFWSVSPICLVTIMDTGH